MEDLKKKATALLYSILTLSYPRETGVCVCVCLCVPACVCKRERERKERVKSEVL